jgi:putative metalloprotease
MDKGLKSFAGQNGSIRLSSGLLDLLNHDELIFILGHEIAHILYKDDKENYQTTYALAGIKEGAQVTGGLTAYLTQTGIDLISQKLNQTKYSKKKERKADRYGLAYLKAYKLDVSVAISALEKLSKHSANLLITHPTSVERVEYLKEHFSQN